MDVTAQVTVPKMSTSEKLLSLAYVSVPRTIYISPNLKEFTGSNKAQKYFAKLGLHLVLLHFSRKFLAFKALKSEHFRPLHSMDLVKIILKFEGCQFYIFHYNKI
jgi:hypothetical protein